MMDVLQEILTIGGIVKGGSVIFILLISETVLFILRQRLSRAHHIEQKNAGSSAEAEDLASAYYRKRQVLGLIRAGVLLVALLIAALLYDIQAFGVLALALGAIVVVQKENINSLVAYFFVLSNFKVTDDIKVGDTLGEIVRISPFMTVLAGKEDNGESNGQLIHIPNYRLITETVRQQELKSTTYRRVVIRAVYIPGQFSVNFDEYLTQARVFLDEFLPKRGLDRVGNFRSFAGSQYKINFDYDEDGYIAVRIAFISRPYDVVDRKEQIIEFLESMRTNNAGKAK